MLYPTYTQIDAATPTPNLAKSSRSPLTHARRSAAAAEAEAEAPQAAAAGVSGAGAGGAALSDADAREAVRARTRAVAWHKPTPKQSEAPEPVRCEVASCALFLQM